MKTADVSMDFWIYMLEVENGNLYTGYTKNLDNRIKQHFSKTGGCKFTRSFKPVALKRCWKIFGTYSQAMSLEKFIKQQTREKKLHFIKHPKSLAEHYVLKTGRKLFIHLCRKKYSDLFQAK